MSPRKKPAAAAGAEVEVQVLKPAPGAFRQDGSWNEKAEHPGPVDEFVQRCVRMARWDATPHDLANFIAASEFPGILGGGFEDWKATIHRELWCEVAAATSAASRIKEMAPRVPVIGIPSDCECAKCERVRHGEVRLGLPIDSWRIAPVRPEKAAEVIGAGAGEADQGELLEVNQGGAS